MKSEFVKNIPVQNQSGQNHTAADIATLKEIYSLPGSAIFMPCLRNKVNEVSKLFGFTPAEKRHVLQALAAEITID